MKEKCFKMSVWLFWSLDAQAQGAVLNTWAVVLMLLATLLRRNQAAVGPSVGVALGKHWQCFSGDTHTHTRTKVCLQRVETGKWRGKANGNRRVQRKNGGKPDESA